MDINALRKDKVGDIVAQLPSLTADQLVELRDAEIAAKDPRETLIAAINETFVSRARGAESVAAEAKADGAPPKHLAADYTGPLSIDQANDRVASGLFAQRIKESTKPAGKHETK